MSTKSQLLRGSTIIALVLIVLSGGRTVNSQTSAPAQPSGDNAVKIDRRCKQSKRSSKRKRVPPLLCGPPVSNTVISAEAAGSNIVEVRVLVDENGKIVSVQPILGNPAFYKKTIKAVNEMKFTPKVLSGRPVKTEVIVRFVIDAGSK